MSSSTSMNVVPSKPSSTARLPTKQSHTRHPIARLYPPGASIHASIHCAIHQPQNGKWGPLLWAEARGHCIIYCLLPSGACYHASVLSCNSHPGSHSPAHSLILPPSRSNHIPAIECIHALTTDASHAYTTKSALARSLTRSLKLTQTQSLTHHPLAATPVSQCDASFKFQTHSQSTECAVCGTVPVRPVGPVHAAPGDIERSVKRKQARLT